MYYSKQLDSLRFIAVFMVLIEHFANPIGTYFSAGYFGVDLFFVISGFLITKVLLNNKNEFALSYKNFIGRRALRILPLYFLVVFILYLIGDTHVKGYLLYCLSFTFNYAMVYFNLPSNAITHFWTICIEEQFYLFWPLLILPFRQHKKWLIVFVFIFLVFCYGQFYFKWIESLVKYRWVGLVPRCFSLLIGALGALTISAQIINRQLFANKKIEWLLLFILAFFLFTHSPIKFIITPLICLYFVLKCYFNGFKSLLFNAFLNHKWMVYLGSISYGIYLIHLPIGYYLSQYFLMPYWDKFQFENFGSFNLIKNNIWIVEFPIYSTLTIFLAGLSYRYIETPFLKLKDKYFSYTNNLNES